MMILQKFFTVFPMVALVWLVFDAQQGAWDTMRMAGCVLLAAGLILNVVARLQLGSSFSITPQAKKLVTHGIYSVVRHPVYVTGMMAIAGMVLYLRQPIFLIVVAIVTVIQFRRSKAEEAVLEAKFGQEYRDYRSRTWF